MARRTPVARAAYPSRMLPLLALAAMQSKDPMLQERTVFQTGRPYDERIDLRGDVAIVYGIDGTMPARIKSWRDKGYRVHLMTGVAWGEYQDYVFGKWDGTNHEDEAQTEQNGAKIGHGKDVFYMSPGPSYGKYLAEGVRKALDAGVDAVHLEEPEFWVRGGYAPAFKREWQAAYGEPWQDPQSSPDARWRANKLMYMLYRRALQQVFDSVQAFNREKGKAVRCYVPTHSLLNYAHWGIVSPESSLARLKGCDGYIAQVWTGTARTPNVYGNVKRERTFETAFLEYGAMQNLVRATGRGVWYLADPIEDNPNHDWADYRRNYHSTLVASLLQPEVSNYEVIPWPERVFNEKYPSATKPGTREPIPGDYAQELQQVWNALKDMRQKDVAWDAGTQGVGVAISDSLMFERGGPSASDGDMSHVYGLALPFLKRGMPVQPVQLENVGLKGYLDGIRVLLLSYEGQKPLSPEVHAPIAEWVRNGGTLVFVDDDKDPFMKVREWWNTGGLSYLNPRQDLFEKLGVGAQAREGTYPVGKGRLVFLNRSPTLVAHDAFAAKGLTDYVAKAAPEVAWRAQGSIALRRGPYVALAGLDESPAVGKPLRGHFVDLFDPQLRVQTLVPALPDARAFLVDLDRCAKTTLACAGALTKESAKGNKWSGDVEGIADTPGVLLLRLDRPAKSATVDGEPVKDLKVDPGARLAWVRFGNTARPRHVEVEF